MTPIRQGWEALQDRLFFLPPFPDQLDPLALFALLLVAGLLAGETLFRSFGLSRIVGYVLAGAVAGPGGLGGLDRETLAMAKPVADAALGLLLLETGRHLDLRWLNANRSLLASALAESALAFVTIFAFALLAVGLSPGWSAATAAITMASAPAVVLLTAEENRAQGQVTQRTLLLTAISCALSFVVFALVLGIVHAEQAGDWLNAIVHPLWVVCGGAGIGLLCARIALAIAARQAKGSVAQVFILVAVALLAIGVARMLAVPVFLSLFMMGAALNLADRGKVLAYTRLPEGHWILAIVLFVVTGAMLPLEDLGWLTGLQALGLLVVRGLAKFAGVMVTGRHDLPAAKRRLVGIGIQPLSATAIFMGAELAAIYPEVSGQALLLPLLAAALMELAGPQLCRHALRQAGETEPPPGAQR
ncbi:MAG: cation:proton antiporter [Zoogloea sp.]|uniref:cation:proton antiporter n=1 Tax=Zoogloea sp. TaxID=49181 RepID=UPI00261AA30E|nr:cation:proton antiporter [Zoogloea sp.]MDD3328758.1 cation:proton antiporter [Zoogloea sp.]